MIALILALFPGRLWSYVAMAGVILGLGGTGAWKVQAWRITNIQAETALALSDAKERVNVAEQANLNRQLEAHNASTKRQITIQAAAAAARSERYGLRDTTHAFVAKSPTAACNERAGAVAVVFDQCAGALTELAFTADRLSSDRQLLLESWPK